MVVQNPDFFGNVEELSDIAKATHKKGALLIVVITEMVSLGVLKPPAMMGADIVVGEGQSLGNGLQFGGPYVGLFGSKKEFVRQMPGRLCGQTIDEDGKRGFVLTLSSREQHIRRAKQLLTSAPMQGFVRLPLPFILHCLVGEVCKN